MEKRIIQIGLIAVAITLMVQPYGVPTFWANPEGPPTIIYYSFFSDVPYSATLNYSPLVTALLSILVIIRLIVSLIINVVKGRDSDNPGILISICLYICILATLASWLFFSAFSIISAIVLATHIGAQICQLMYKRD